MARGCLIFCVGAYEAFFLLFGAKVKREFFPKRKVHNQGDCDENLKGQWQTSPNPKTRPVRFRYEMSLCLHIFPRAILFRYERSLYEMSRYDMSHGAKCLWCEASRYEKDRNKKSYVL